ncbi:AMP-binding enzyme [Variovorax flavidus]|uniref:AMP-binding enzyme n=1 Tax=Variovorax flavidus TaxID=3053501 RepID=UPI00403793AB
MYWRTVVQLRAGRGNDIEKTAQEIQAFVKARIGSVKTPKQVEVWPDLPRSKVGKVLKRDIRSTLFERLRDAAGKS